MPEPLVTRTDSWRSTLTNLGGVKDKRNSYTFCEQDKGPEEWEMLFDGNDLAKKICSMYPDEAHREGVKLVVPEDPEKSAELDERVEELNAVALMTEAAVFANVTGDAGVFILASDGKELIEPLDVENVVEVFSLRVIDRRDVVVAQWYQDPLDPLFNTPMTYRFNVLVGQNRTVGEEIHESRFIWFAGSRTSRRKRRERGGWHFSRLYACQTALRDFGISWEGAAYMLQDASQAVFKLKDLLSTIASEGGAELLEKRMEMVEMARSVARSMLLDAEMEDFVKVATTFTGVPDLLQSFAARLAAAADMPVTKLMGTQPTGLQATGEADETTWHNSVAAYQTKDLKPGWCKLAAVLAAEAGIKADVRVKVVFPPLDRMTPIQTTTMRNMQATTDKLYVDAQVLTPEEVAISRFRKDGYSLETQVNLDVREEVQAQNEAEGNVGGGVVSEKQAQEAEQAKALAAAKGPIGSGASKVPRA